MILYYIIYYYIILDDIFYCITCVYIYQIKNVSL